LTEDVAILGDDVVIADVIILEDGAETVQVL